MIVSYEIKHSAIEWLKMVETKMLVDKWMFLRMKIIPTIWLHKNTLFKSNWWLHSNKTGSDTVPVQRRLDFKQALSTFQQLKQKEGAQRNQQWAQSSSSSWWSWQGSWWTPYSHESHHGDEPSIDRTGWLVIQVFGTSLQGMIFLNPFTFVTDGSFTADGVLL